MSQKTKNIITEILTGLGIAQSVLNFVPHCPLWVGVAVAGLVNVLNEYLKDNTPAS